MTSLRIVRYKPEPNEHFLRSIAETRRRVRRRAWLAQWGVGVVLAGIALLCMVAVLMSALVSKEILAGIFMGLSLGLLVVATLKALEKL